MRVSLSPPTCKATTGILGMTRVPEQIVFAYHTFEKQIGGLKREPAYIEFVHGTRDEIHS